MTWDINAPYKPEVQKCRSRLLRYCQGQGLDLGCGIEKIKPDAIGIDIDGKAVGADFAANIETGLTLFANDYFDYIFSSHYLEHVREPVQVLQDWWRILKYGGNLVLYLPHKDHYPRMGQEGANPDHKADYEASEILGMMDLFASYEILVNEVRSEDDEYSFELVLKKLARTPGFSVEIPKKERPKRKALVIRYGGIGDIVFATPIFRLLKEDGYHVTFNTVQNGMEVTKHNPYIDEYIFQGVDEVPNRILSDYWRGLEKHYDRIINLSGSCEDALLKIKKKEDDGYDWPLQERRDKLGHINYYDFALERADLGGRIERPRGEIFLSEEEELYGQMFRKTFDGRFIVVWALSGSGPQKTFPYAPHAMAELVARHPETLVITTGGYTQRLLELANDEGPNFMFRSGRWTVRNLIVAIKYADLVFGPETGALNIAGCFDTPKICLLSHSSHNNLCKYWKNDYSAQSLAECSPCHRMIEHRDQCPVDETHRIPICATEFTPNQIFDRIKEVHRLWARSQRTGLIVLPGKAATSTRKRAKGKGG